MSRTVRYRLLNKIAHGGMAEIFLAIQVGAEGFEKQVVLKRILPALAADPSFVRMLVDEAHIASTLNHSNLVQVLDLGKSGDEFFLVLEFVDGWSLEQVRRRALKARMKLPLPLALYVVGALCRALAYVHTRKRDGRPLGIVHRDVNPQNVLLSREGEVKLADFGIAKAIGKREKSATGVIKGKFAYMSPEQSIGAELDARSDLFSVGTLLYILTTGKKPFEGTTDLDLLMQVRQARFEKPSTLVKDFNPDVERFIVRALRADPERRWQNAEQMADRIDTILLKLGQAFGPAALKRWLENLSAKDGVKAPAEDTEPAMVTGTIQLGTRDLELQDVSLLPDRDEGAPSPMGVGEPSRPNDTAMTPEPVYASDAGTRASSQTSQRATGARSQEDEAVSRASSRPSERAASDGHQPKEAVTRDAKPPRALLDDEVALAAPTRIARAGRRLRRATIAMVAMLVLLAGTAYVAQPYLPPQLVGPVKAWLQHLPVAGRQIGDRARRLWDTL